MDKEKEIMRWITAITLSLATVMFFLRMALIWRDVDLSTGLFRVGGSTLCTVYNALGTALLIGALVAALIARRFHKRSDAARAEQGPVQDFLDKTDPLFAEEMYMGEELDLPEPQTDSDVSTAATWEGALSAFSYLLPGFGFLFFALSFILQGSLDILVLSFCLISAACGAYFLISGFRNRTDKNVPFAFFGLVPAVWATLRMIIEYRDVEKYANRSMYTANLIFLVAVVCFFVYQAQVTLGHASYAMPLSWFAAALLVVLFGISARLPQLLGLVFDRLGEMDLVDAAGLLLDLSLTLFAGLKIRRMVR